MPRIYASNNDAYDFCKKHMPDEDDAWDRFSKMGLGPDDRQNCFGYDSEHPPYEDEDYQCHECGKLLGEEDN